MIGLMADPGCRYAFSTSYCGWKAEVTDLMALVDAVAANKVPLFYLQANEKALNDAARAAKAALNIPGVKPVEDRRTRG